MTDQLPQFPLDKQYRLIRKLGGGGFGDVWLAEDVLIEDRYVAVKRLRNDVVDTSILLDEMRHLSKLDHPNIVKFLHHTQDVQTLYLVMEYCAGGSLDAHVQGKPISYDKVFSWGYTLARALAEAHRNGIVHHDIKPQNILIDADGTLKVADFGGANRDIGTTRYIPPEFLLGEAAGIDARFDVYSLGITLLELLLGQSPFHDMSRKEILRSKIQHDFIPSTLGAWVEAILLKATHPTPEQRFQTMNDFAEAIYSRHVPFVIDGVKMKAHAWAEKAARQLSRNRWVSARKYLDRALHMNPDCIAAHVYAGRLELMLKRVSHAKEHFSKAIRINPRVPLQKELGWMALEAGSYPQAISMLNDHLQRDASDYEACNFLIQCFFDTGRYELGLLLAKTVIAQKPGNDCFENNHFLCELMANEAAHSFLDGIDRSELVNPFKRMNFDIATEPDASWSRKNGPPLKSKLLFQEFRFGRNVSMTLRHQRN